MISVPVFITTIITLCICFVLPLGYLFVVESKRTNVLKPYWLGAVAFFAAQVLIRLPLMNTLGTNEATKEWYRGMVEGNVWVYALFVAGTTALVECLARYIMVRLTLSDRNRFVDAVSMGVGHGLTESVMFTGITMVGLLLYFIYINTGTLGEMTGYQGAALEELKEQCLAMNSGDMLFLGGERLSSMAMQIGYTVMIYLSVKGRKPLLAVGAFLWQMIPNMLIVLQPAWGMSEWLLLGIYGVLGALAVFYVYSQRNNSIWKLTNEKKEESLRAITHGKF